MIRKDWKDTRRQQRWAVIFIRISQFASSDEDNFAIRRFIQRSTSQDGIRRPLIAYNVGRLGRASMCFNTILTTVTHAKVRALSGREGHQALLTMQEASRITYDLGLLDPLHFCIFGGSVLYSLSPAMHNAAYQSVGLLMSTESVNLLLLRNLMVYSMIHHLEVRQSLFRSRSRF